MEGKIIGGKFKIIQLLKDNGIFQKHFKGVNLQTNQFVMIKKSKDKFFQTSHQQILTSLLLNKFKHANIAEYYGKFKIQNYQYLIQQYFPRGNIKFILKKWKVLKQQKYAKCIIRQVLASIAYLNRHKLVYMYISPDNIFIDDNMQIKLTNFFFAEFYENLQKKLMRGIPLYMPPQQLKREDYNQTCDIWALGVLLYNILYGKLPYYPTKTDGQGIIGLINCINKNQIKFSQQIKITSQCRRFIKDCLNKQYKSRPSAQTLLKHQWFNEQSETDLYPLLALADNQKQISLNFLLHINEDFDDDLLLDVIGLLHDIK